MTRLEEYEQAQRDYMEKVQKIRADIKESIDCAKRVLATVKIPDKKDRWNYWEGSSSVNSFCETMRTVRMLCLNAMKDAECLK